jgi:hypothetical protein
VLLEKLQNVPEVSARLCCHLLRCYKGGNFILHSTLILYSNFHGWIKRIYENSQCAGILCRFAHGTSPLRNHSANPSTPPIPVLGTARFQEKSYLLNFTLHLRVIRFDREQEKQCTYNVTWRRVRVTIVALKKQ